MAVRNYPRVIFVGDSGVGKTSLISRIRTNTFDPYSTPTIGAGHANISSEVDGEKVEYQLWDTAGQETYRSLVPIYFKGACCAIVTFSFSDMNSFKSIPTWLEQIEESGQTVPIILVGNKADEQQPEVQLAEAKKWSSDHSFPFFAVSAKTGQNVNLLLNYIETHHISNGSEHMHIDESKAKSESDSCC